MPFSLSNTVTPPIVILPSVGVSRPAIIRRVVVLPQPDGPNKVMNELSSMTRFKLSTA